MMLDGEHLVVAMADPLDVYALDDVGIAARRPVKAVVAIESEVETGIGRAYGMGAAAQAVLQDVPGHELGGQPGEREIRMFVVLLRDREGWAAVDHRLHRGGCGL